MANAKKSSKKFGKSTGINLSKRRKIRPGRPRYEYKAISKSSSVSSNCRVKLCIKKSHCVPKKKLRKQFKHINKYSDIFTVCNISTPEPNSFKLKISRLQNVSANGYRVINLDCLQNHVMQITMHVCQCPAAVSLAAYGKSPIKLISELRTLGLASILMAECQGCRETFKFETSPKLNNTKHYDINVRAVWGSVVTGNGPSHLNELFGTLDSPGMSQATFSTIEEKIGEWWKNILEKEMLIAGMDERQIAINKGNYHGDIPCITVVTDGGWCKRTHKHSYNALGGVAIIIGQETKKILHVGVRNKYCYICTTAASKHVEPKPHKCFCNWHESSQAMEADIIVEGFRQAESKHGLRYTKVICDGDSSVYAKIKEEVAIWGRDVEKLECANHACKCLRSNLEKLISDNPMYKGKHHLSKSTRVRLVSAVRCAIRMRSKQALQTGNRKESTKLLRHDITQSVHHIFGSHDNCSDFCKSKSNNTVSNLPPQTESDTSSTGSKLPQHDETETVSDVLDLQVNMWSEGTSLEAQEESRSVNVRVIDKVETFIIRDVSLLLSRLAAKSDRLIGNITTNLAESWMHIRSKFDGGKLYNLCNRGSWHGRCYGGALRMNLGPKWSPKVWKTVTASEPGNHFTKLYVEKEKRLNNSTIHKAKAETHIKRWKRKIMSLKQANSVKAKQSYGPQAVDVVDDVTPDQLKTLSETFLDNNINLTPVQIDAVENATKSQSQSGLWHSERRKRLTASNFGPIVKRNPSLPVQKIVRKFLYSNFKGNRHTRNGLLSEQITIEEYKMKKAEENINVSVEAMGLVINKEDKFLAASPDGRVLERNGNRGLLEIKNLLHDKPLNLWQASSSLKNFCLEIKSGKLHLRENHDYFYQCHGLMNVCDFPWIDFVVRTLNPYQLFIQRIFKDRELWINTMYPKLASFYKTVLLPELTCPREGKSPGIREPGVWVSFNNLTVGPPKCQFVPPNSTKAKQQRQRKRKDIRTQTTQSNKKQRDDLNIEGTSYTTASCTTNNLSRRSKRTAKVKFVGRTIKHEWIVDEATDKHEWYRGTVLSVVSGVDGDSSAVYDIAYEGFDDTYEVENLLDDYRSSSVIFTDI